MWEQKQNKWAFINLSLQSSQTADRHIEVSAPRQPGSGSPEVLAPLIIY